MLVDRSGVVVNLNRRFAQMWEVPDEVIAQHDDEAILCYMANCFAEPARFLSRADRIKPDADDETFATLRLQDNRVFECRSRPAWHGEQIIGRVYTYTDEMCIRDSLSTDQRSQRHEFFEPRRNHAASPRIQKAK